MQVGVLAVWVPPFVLHFQLWDQHRCVSHCLRGGICLLHHFCSTSSSPNIRGIILVGCLRSQGKISSLHTGHNKEVWQGLLLVSSALYKNSAHTVLIGDPRISLQTAQLKSSLTSPTNSNLSEKISVRLTDSRVESSWMCSRSA